MTIHVVFAALTDQDAGQFTDRIQLLASEVEFLSFRSESSDGLKTRCFDMKFKLWSPYDDQLSFQEYVLKTLLRIAKDDKEVRGRETIYETLAVQEHQDVCSAQKRRVLRNTETKS